MMIFMKAKQVALDSYASSIFKLQLHSKLVTNRRKCELMLVSSIFFFLIRHLCLEGVWLGVALWAYTIETHV